VASGDQRLRSLETHLGRLEERLDKIEGLLLSQESQMDEVRSLFAFFRGSIRFYDEVSNLLSYISSFRRATEHGWISKDQLAKDIILSLARKGPRNISELTRDIREERGKASRRIVAKRVQQLLESGIVTEATSGGSRRVKLGEGRADSGAREQQEK